MTADRCRRTILIVEDDPDVNATFAKMLRLSGYSVYTAYDADRGLLMFRQEAPAAVLVDLRMPLTDGFAFVRSVREREAGQRTPIAVITGDYMVDSSIADSLWELGAAVYFK